MGKVISFHPKNQNIRGEWIITSIDQCIIQQGKSMKKASSNEAKHKERAEQCVWIQSLKRKEGNSC